MSGAGFDHADLDVAATQPYQRFDPLPAATYEALKADIAKNGMLYPVLEDEHGTVIAGHHRKRAWQELLARGEVFGDCPRVVHTGLTDAEKVDLADRDSLLRRQLGPLAMGRALLRICEREGVRSGAGARNDRTSITVIEVAAKYGIRGATAMRNLGVARQLARRPDLAAKVDAGELSATQACALARAPRDPIDTVPMWDEEGAGQGMPAIQADLEPASTLVVKFPTPEARAAFAKLLGRSIEDREPGGIWYPKPPPIGHYWGEKERDGAGIALTPVEP